MRKDSRFYFHSDRWEDGGELRYQCESVELGKTRTGDSFRVYMAPPGLPAGDLCYFWGGVGPASAVFLKPGSAGLQLVGDNKRLLPCGDVFDPDDTPLLARCYDMVFRLPDTDVLLYWSKDDDEIPRGKLGIYSPEAGQRLMLNLEASGTVFLKK